jgi:predicted metal-dependent phosphoesterase TrpH
MLADLHNHSCLSPCATLEMSPRVIARRAAAVGLGVVALTDHNCALNCPAFADACARESIIPIFGMEITTSEEAHVLALFGELDAAMDAGEWVGDHLPFVPVTEDMACDQPVVDVDEHILQFVETFLISATDITLAEAVKQIHARDGLVIPCHLDRAYFSIETQLGFLPPDAYDAIEVLQPSLAAYRLKYPDYPVITNSDAHHPERIGATPTELDTDGSLPSLKHAFTKLLKRTL